MKRLRDSRLWLRIPEAARYLSVTTGEHHDEADVLRAALDEQIQLSVDLPVPVLVNQISGAPAPPSTALEISGLFDLVLEGNGRLMIENWWRKESNLPKLPMNKIGVIVASEQGKKYQFPPWNAPLPKDSIVVVKRTLLDAALRQIQENNQPTRVRSKDLGSRERTTLLTIIATLAKEAEIDISQPSKAALVIENLTELLGERVAARTIEDKLNLIKECFPKAPDPQRKK